MIGCSVYGSESDVCDHEKSRGNEKCPFQTEVQKRREAVSMCKGFHDWVTEANLKQHVLEGLFQTLVCNFHLLNGQ